MSAQGDPLRLEEAWATSTGEGVTVAVLDAGFDLGAVDLDERLVTDGDADGSTTDAGNAPLLRLAFGAPDASLLPMGVTDDTTSAAEALATAIADTAEQEVGVLALTLDEPELDDEQVGRAIEAAVASGSVVVTGPGAPEDLPVVVVTDQPGDDERAIAGGSDEPVATVAAVAALITAQGRTPEEVADVLVGTAQGEDRTVDAAAAVEQAGNVGAGGTPLPDADGAEGGLSPATIGLIALVAAGGTIGTVIVIGTRTPRSRR